MSKPFIHAQASARRFGGKPEDYIELHNFMDSSKSAFPSNIHRVLTHQSWFIMVIGERIKFSNSNPPTNENKFITIKNSDGKDISVRDIFEDHILQDFGMRFIPTVQDYLENMEYKDWMGNVGKSVPSSFKKINNKKEKKKEENKENELNPQFDPKNSVVFYDRRPDKFKNEEPFFIDKGPPNIKD